LLISEIYDILTGGKITVEIPSLNYKAMAWLESAIVKYKSED